MPSQKGFGGNEKGSPSASREQTVEYGKHRPIRWSISHACIELALKDAHLVSEHHEFDLVVGLGATYGQDKTEESTQAEVDEREDHVG
jgi:hypothetical protein